MEQAIADRHQALTETEERPVLEADGDRRAAGIVGAGAALEFGPRNLDLRDLGLLHSQHHAGDPVLQQTGPSRTRIDEDRDAELGLGIERELGRKPLMPPPWEIFARPCSSPRRSPYPYWTGSPFTRLPRAVIAW